MGNIANECSSRKRLSQQKLRRVLRYDHETGDFFWLRHRNRFLVGEKAGSCNAAGYWVIKIDSVAHLAHRLAWLYRTGSWPKEQIDHINRNRLDNRFHNLRDVRNSLNRANSFLGRNNKSGFRGVSERNGRWIATIKIDGTRRHLGTFDTPEEAQIAYVSATNSVSNRIVGELRSACIGSSL